MHTIDIRQAMERRDITRKPPMETENRLLLEGSGVRVWQRIGGTNPGFFLCQDGQPDRFFPLRRDWGKQRDEVLVQARLLVGWSGTITPPPPPDRIAVGSASNTHTDFETAQMMGRWYQDMSCFGGVAYGENPPPRR